MSKYYAHPTIDSMRGELYSKYTSLHLIINILGSAFFLSSCMGKDQEEVSSQIMGENRSEVVYVADPDKVLEGPTLSLPKQVINLKDGSLLFLKVSVQYSDLVRPEGEESLVPRILDGILEVTSGYGENNLRTPKQKEEFRGRIKEQVSQSLSEYTSVEAIYFEEFLIK